MSRTPIDIGDTSKVLEVLRFRSHTEGSCRVWHGAWSGAGYGYLVVDGERLSARRLSYEAEHTYLLRNNQTVLSTCGNTKCIKPSHLTVKTKGRGGRPKSS